MPRGKKSSPGKDKRSTQTQSQKNHQEQVDSVQAFSAQVDSSPFWRSFNPKDSNQDRKLSPLRKSHKQANIVTAAITASAQKSDKDSPGSDISTIQGNRILPTTMKKSNPSISLFLP